ncbi:hypothetical protein K7432_017959 [Basidiobolus ranarum]|uniref:Uncharacterized protein n=1 Tax=Basidiobolus ranarum TaxID=34480 RepID=A0ABR2VJN1_9FUNG
MSKLRPWGYGQMLVKEAPNPRLVVGMDGQVQNSSELFRIFLDVKDENVLMNKA